MSPNALFLALAFGASVITAADLSSAAPTSTWVSQGSDGKLVYRMLPGGDRIMDFSHAGYGGGGIPLPVPPVRQTVRPSGGDDTAAIQAALDAVGKLDLVGGLRGAVLLAPGRFRCSGGLVIRASGVVLRGSGSGEGGSSLQMEGRPHVCLTLGGGEKSSARPLGKPIPITDAYVPSGASTLRLASTTGIAAGDTVLIQRPITKDWLHFMGMDGLVRDGRQQTWMAPGGTIRTERRVVQVAGDTLSLDVPLSDKLEARHLAPLGASVVKSEPPVRLSQIGVEHLRIISPPQAVTINDAHHQALRATAIEDAWLRDVAIVDTVNSIHLGPATLRMTLDRVSITHAVATLGAAKPADFAINGSQILLSRCTGSGDGVFFVGTGGGVTGPNVVWRCSFRGVGWIQPHMRWATGLLIDQCEVPEGGIDFMNRGSMGSGHGWAIGWAVAWNCRSKTLLIQRPPGTANWAIGCQGERRTEVMPFKVPPVLPEGIVDSPGVPVSPGSLYLAQLQERLGGTASVP
jgi:hypothetical protein